MTVVVLLGAWLALMLVRLSAFGPVRAGWELAARLAIATLIAFAAATTIAVIAAWAGWLEIK